jgi:hypothetical protein
MMNEKIKELAEDAGYCYAPVDEGYENRDSYNSFDYKEFAELILMEAMGIVRDEVSFFSDWACADNAVTKVKEHFGVE